MTAVDWKGALQEVLLGKWGMSLIPGRTENRAEKAHRKKPKTITCCDKSGWSDLIYKKGALTPL